MDTRVSDIIEHGASGGIYFLRVDLPRVVAQSENLIKPVRVCNVPISSALPTHLLDILRRLLGPPTVAPKALRECPGALKTFSRRSATRRSARDPACRCETKLSGA